MDVIERDLAIRLYPHLPAHPSFLPRGQSPDNDVPDRNFPRLTGFRDPVVHIPGLPDQFFYPRDLGPLLQCRHLSPGQ